MSKQWVVKEKVKGWGNAIVLFDQNDEPILNDRIAPDEDELRFFMHLANKSAEMKSQLAAKDALISEVIEFLKRIRPNLITGSRNKIDALIEKATKS